MSDSLDRSIQVGNLRLYPDVAGRWTVSDGGMWLPGIYDSREAAMRAAGLPDEVLHNTLRPICHVDGENRPIPSPTSRPPLRRNRRNGEAQ